MKRRKPTKEVPEWSADIGRGMKLEVSAVLDEFRDRPLTYVASLRTEDGTLYKVGELVESGGRVRGRIDASEVRARGADLPAVIDAWEDMIRWATVRTTMNE